MYSLTDEQKKMFYSSGYYKGYRMVFPDIDLTIDNEILHQESVTITQSIFSDQELTLGGCIASSIQFEVSEVMDKDVTGLEFQCYMDVEDANGNTVLTIPMGVYRVDSAKCVDDKDYKKIVAYDALYDASTDAGELYNSIFDGDFTMTIDALRMEILSHYGIQFAGGSFVNDDVIVGKTIEPGIGNITGTTILKYICESNGAFGYIDRYGRFAEKIISGSIGVYPEVDLYPEEKLYPATGGNSQYIGTESDMAQYISTKFEEYETMPITCVTIKSSSDDIGVSSSDDESNPYVISSNFLFFGKEKEELKEISAKIHGSMKEIIYRPNDTELEGLPYMDLGDWYSLTKQRESVICPVFSRILKGIQGLRDTYTAKGSKVRANETTSRDELIQNMGKMLEIKKSIDGVSVDVKDLDERESSHFEQTSNQIVMKVDKDGRMVLVELGTNADDGKNYYRVSADSIDLTAEDIINLISGKEINLTTKQIRITADNFSVDESGHVTASGMDLTNSSINSPNFTVDESGHVVASDMELVNGVISSKNFNVDKDGHVTANAISVSGGEINLITNNSEKSLISLTDYEIYAKCSNGDILTENDIRFKGEGSPKDPTISGVGEVDVEGAEPGDFYMDTKTFSIYQLISYGSSGNHWSGISLAETPTVNTKKTSMSTSGSFQSSQSKEVKINNQKYQDGYATELLPEKIHLKKEQYVERMGIVRQENIEADISVETGEYSERNESLPVIVFSTPIKTEKVTAKKIRFSDDLDVNMEFTADSGGQTGDIFLTGNVSSVAAPYIAVREYNSSGEPVAVKFVHKKIERDFSTDPLPSTGWLEISTPYIHNDFPVTVQNGDGVLCPDLEFTHVQIMPAEDASESKIRAFVTRAITGKAVITYSYWS